MSANMSVNALTALAFCSILILIVPQAIGDDAVSKIELYSNVPDWAIKQYGQSVIGLNVISGNYKLVNGTTLKAGSEMFVLEEWMTFQEGLHIDVGKGGIALKGDFYSEGEKLLVNQGGKTVPQSQ